ncbi:MAG: hypothetical protein IT487_19785 [Chromatiaceae bacterium]|nr:hypothetical protein [Chromatiaceae bacterium]
MISPQASSSLRPYWLVALKGHRHLRQPEAVGEALAALLGALSEEIDGTLVGVSSIAPGADTRFAEAILGMSLPWRALLPVSLAELRRDFTAEEWRYREQLLARATEIQVRGRAADRDEADLECGLDTLDQADLLIAVWDERPAGGTAAIVAYARGVGKPLIILNPETLGVRREGWEGHPFLDHELRYLNRLEVGAAMAPPDASPVPPVLWRFFTKVDQMATRTAPNFRRWVASSLVLNTGATLLVASIIAFALRLPVLDALAFLMSAGAMGAGFYLKYRKVHQRWIHCRVAAEICRAAIATWELPRLVLPDLQGLGETFARLATSVRMMHLCARPAVPPPLEEIRERYVRDRIEDQIRYHQARAVRLARRRQRLISLFWFFSALAVLRGLFVGLYGTEGFSLEAGRTLTHFLPLALPGLAGCALALISVFDLNGQLAHSRALTNFLFAARAETRACHHLYALQRAIARTERYLAREIADWFALGQEPRYG